VELSTYLRTTPSLNRELEGAWDSALLSHLLHVENVWGVLITSGAGEIVYSELQRELPPHCPDLLDMVAGAIAHSGERLQVGNLRFTVFMFSGTLVVGRHTESGASAFILASPEANLGQLLAQIRKVHLGSEAWGESQS
jgi:predicted regulator of Ras-like GTPase activity (Roadblock/LC7/MglB family)